MKNVSRPVTSSKHFSSDGSMILKEILIIIVWNVALFWTKKLPFMKINQCFKVAHTNFVPSTSKPLWHWYKRFKIQVTCVIFLVFAIYNSVHTIQISNWHFSNGIWYWKFSFVRLIGTGFSITPFKIVQIRLNGFQIFNVVFLSLNQLFDAGHCFFCVLPFVVHNLDRFLKNRLGNP